MHELANSILLLETHGQEPEVPSSATIIRERDLSRDSLALKD
jgi:hypothetical protein